MAAPSGSPSGPGRSASTPGRYPASRSARTTAAPQRDVLADVLEAFGGDNGLQWPALAERLAARFPERWDGATGDTVSAELRARGVRSASMSRRTARRARAAAAPTSRRRPGNEPGPHRVALPRPRSASANALSRDRRDQLARLACAVAGRGSRYETTEETAPWPCCRARSEEHRYQTCQDEYCDRFPCRVYREGYRNGYEDGYGDGLRRRLRGRVRGRASRPARPRTAGSES